MNSIYTQSFHQETARSQAPSRPNVEKAYLTRDAGLNLANSLLGRSWKRTIRVMLLSLIPSGGGLSSSVMSGRWLVAWGLR